MFMDDQLNYDMFGTPNKLQVNDILKKMHVVIYNLWTKLQVSWLEDEFESVSVKSNGKFSYDFNLHWTKKSGVSLLKINFLACRTRMGGPS